MKEPSKFEKQNANGIVHFHCTTEKKIVRAISVMIQNIHLHMTYIKFSPPIIHALCNASFFSFVVFPSRSLSPCVFSPSLCFSLSLSLCLSRSVSLCPFRLRQKETMIREMHFNDGDDDDNDGRHTYTCPMRMTALA